MKILVTGSKGFLGKNLIANLSQLKDLDIVEYDIENSIYDLEKFTKDCEFVFHLAGINRPLRPSEFIDGNLGLTENLINCLEKNNNKCPILLTSSIQAKLDNDYGKSKKMAEDVIVNFHNKNGNKIFIYRLPNLFGKWSKQNYNSVIATWCYNISHDIEIKINDENIMLELAYIDDVVSQFINCLKTKSDPEEYFYEIPVTYKKNLGEIAKLIRSFKEIKENLFLPNIGDPFTKKLYSTYLSFLDENNFSYDLKMNIDDRGSFTECLKFASGQFSVNVCKPGITKGNHWHNTKIEKFIAVQGEGQFNFRKYNSSDVITYNISSKKICVIDVPPGYIHNFTNTGKDDLIVLIWCNEIFNLDNPDTFFERV